MKPLILVTAFFFSLCISNCSVKNWDVSRYKGRFEEHKMEFEKLVGLLKSESLKIDYAINTNELSENIREILRELNITDVNLRLTQCEGLVSYEFTTSWNNMATVYFSKDICNKEQTATGFHDKTLNMIEIWGLGDEWTMWIDHDPI